jgi:hypothetical protein
VIGDVSGHGAGSALITGTVLGTWSLLSQWAKDNPNLVLDPRPILSLMNRTIYDAAKDSLNMTMFAIVVNTETIECLVADAASLPDPVSNESVLDLLKSRGVEYTDWTGWLRLNQHEIELGAKDQSAVERERVKVVERDEQVAIAKG